MYFDLIFLIYGLDLKRYGWYSERNRNKTSKAVITQIPNKYGAKTSKPSYISYSMNKKKRWLLPAALKEEIYAEKVAGKSDLVSYQFVLISGSSMLITFFLDVITC